MDTLNSKECRKFIREFAKITKPITVRLMKNNTVKHTPDFTKSLELGKTLIINSPKLQYPDFKKPFTLTTYASNFALGTVLSQGDPPHEKLKIYPTPNDRETKYSTILSHLVGNQTFGHTFKIYMIANHCYGCSV